MKKKPIAAFILNRALSQMETLKSLLLLMCAGLMLAACEDPLAVGSKMWGGLTVVEKFSVPTLADCKVKARTEAKALINIKSIREDEKPFSIFIELTDARFVAFSCVRNRNVNVIFLKAETPEAPGTNKSEGGLNVVEEANLSTLAQCKAKAKAEAGTLHATASVSEDETGVRVKLKNGNLVIFQCFGQQGNIRFVKSEERAGEWPFQVGAKMPMGFTIMNQGHCRQWSSVTLKPIRSCPGKTINARFMPMRNLGLLPS